jgi:protein transport protein HofB
MNYFHSPNTEANFSDILNEFEENVSDENLNEKVVALVRHQNSNKEWLQLQKSVIENSHLIERKRVEIWKCFVLEVNPSPGKKYSVGIVDFHNRNVRTAISRYLQIYSNNAIEFRQLQPGIFDMLFNAVYSSTALASAKVRAEREYANLGGGKTRVWGKRIVEDEDGAEGKKKTLEDYSGQRLDLTNMEEYYRTLGALQAGTLVEDDMNIDDLAKFILQDFTLSGSSDLHLHCGPKWGRVRYRFQGECSTKLDKIPHDKFGQLVNAYCILGGKDPQKMTREPVETVIKLRILLDEEVKDVEFRFESLQSQPKPSVNLRGQSKPIVDIHKIGYYPDQLELLALGYSRRNGVNIITGETGSGKTNSLNAISVILEEDDKKNIVEFGSPIEIESQNRVQVTIKETGHEKETDKIYAQAFKASLRFDPDIIFFTEIRNTNEAKTALRAANTGHLVFTTMHAADVEEAFARLFDMGLSRDMIAKGIVLICAQTLIKKLCRFCKLKDNTASIKANCPIYIENKTGCEHCKEGFSGRTVVAEVLLMNDDVREWIRLGHSPGEIRRRAINGKHLTPLHEIALRKVRDGLSTENEIAELIAAAGEFGNHSDDDRMDYAQSAGVSSASGYSAAPERPEILSGIPFDDDDEEEESYIDVEVETGEITVYSENVEEDEETGENNVLNVH